MTIEAPIYAGRFEAVIGLEVHAQALTRTKIFCPCPTGFGQAPNTQTCPVCTGMPGSLPVLNREALRLAVLTGLALDCRINPVSRFARKNYFYPDLPKGYQISQYELPICERGHLDIELDGRRKRIGITRLHMEEDAGKNVHREGSDFSLVDLNRTGVPLMEIVSEPDLRSPREAAEYMRRLRGILRYIGACDGNLEEGSLRCDANISVRKRGETALGTRAELKNINSFKFVEKAIEYEIRRQASVVLDGGVIVQETRLWDSDRGVTVPMRSKEEAHDYRYFPDPDLVPVTVSEGWLDEIRGSLPELPAARSARYASQYALPPQAASQLSLERETAEWFEAVIASGGNPREAANWMVGELQKALNEGGLEIGACRVTPRGLAELLGLVEAGTISGRIAKGVLDEMLATGGGAGEIVRARGLLQISDSGELEAVVEAILAANPGEVGRFRGGEVKLMGFFVGQVMKQTGGKANPKEVNRILKARLEGQGASS